MLWIRWCMDASADFVVLKKMSQKNLGACVHVPCLVLGTASSAEFSNSSCWKMCVSIVKT